MIPSMPDQVERTAFKGRVFKYVGSMQPLPQDIENEVATCRWFPDYRTLIRAPPLKGGREIPPYAGRKEKLCSYLLKREINYDE